jgi:hypothetical protein
MTDTLPAFFTPDRLLLFWHYVRIFVGYVMPIIMIAAALAIATGVIGTILDVFQKRKTKKDDDDDDYERYEY